MPGRKIEFEELFNSTTMFYVNEDYEEEMEQEVQKKVDELAAELHSIDTKEGLKAYRHLQLLPQQAGIKQGLKLHFYQF